MSKRINIHQIRYSDEVAQMLENVGGRTLHDKFENLIKYCYFKIQDQQCEIEFLDRRIADKRVQLNGLYKEIEDLRKLDGFFTVRASDVFRLISYAQKTSSF